MVDGGQRKGLSTMNRTPSTWIPNDAWSQTDTNQLSHLDNHTVATCISQWVVLLSGRRNYRYSFELIWQRAEGLFVFETEGLYFSKCIDCKLKKKNLLSFFTKPLPSEFIGHGQQNLTWLFGNDSTGTV